MPRNTSNTSRNLLSYLDLDTNSVSETNVAFKRSKGATFYNSKLKAELICDSIEQGPSTSSSYFNKTSTGKCTLKQPAHRANTPKRQSSEGAYTQPDIRKFFSKNNITVNSKSSRDNNSPVALEVHPEVQVLAGSPTRLGAGADDNSSAEDADRDAVYSVTRSPNLRFESDSTLLVAHNTGTEEMNLPSHIHTVTKQLDDGYSHIEALDICEVHKHTYSIDKNFDLNFAYNERFTEVAKITGTYNYLDYIRAKNIHGVPRAMIDIVHNEGWQRYPCTDDGYYLYLRMLCDFCTCFVKLHIARLHGVFMRFCIANNILPNCAKHIVNNKMVSALNNDEGIQRKAKSLTKEYMRNLQRQCEERTKDAAKRLRYATSTLTNVRATADDLVKLGQVAKCGARAAGVLMWNKHHRKYNNLVAGTKDYKTLKTHKKFTLTNNNAHTKAERIIKKR